MDARHLKENLVSRWADSHPVVRSIVLVAALIGLLLIGVQWSASSRPQTEWLLNGRRFTDAQINRLLKAFAEAKLSGYQLSEGRIGVPTQDADRFMAAAAQGRALPGDWTAYTEQAFERPGLLESERDRQRRIQVARERDLTRAITEFRGVENAFVLYDEAKSSGLNRKTIATASVALWPEGDNTLSRQQIEAIRNMVAAANAQLQPENVNVTDMSSGRCFSANNPNLAANSDTEYYLRIKRALESQIQEKLGEMLHFLPQAKLVVNAEPKTQLTHNGDETSGNLLADRLVSVNVAIAIPEDYIRRKAYLRSDSETTPAQQRAAAQAILRESEQQVRDACQLLFGVNSSDDSLPDLNVAISSFRDTQLSWLAGWKYSDRLSQTYVWTTLVGVLLAGVTICCLRQMLRRKNRSTAVPESRLPEEVPQFHVSWPRTPADDDEHLRQTLESLVREDPDTAAKVLNRWIAKAG